MFASWASCPLENFFDSRIPLPLHLLQLGLDKMYVSSTTPKQGALHHLPIPISHNLCISSGGLLRWLLHPLQCSLPAPFINRNVWISTDEIAYSAFFMLTSHQPKHETTIYLRYLNFFSFFLLWAAVGEPVLAVSVILDMLCIKRIKDIPMWRGAFFS